MKKFVIEGGPCSGKTAIICELNKRGYYVIEEAARLTIEKEQQKEKDIPDYKGIFPWTEPEKFHHLLIEKQLEFEKDIPKEIAFSDRSLIGTLCYLEYHKKPIPESLFEHIKNANYKKIFFLEQIPDYKKDEQRKESPEEAMKIKNVLLEGHKKFSVPLIHVPVFSIGEEGIQKRVEFILNNLE